MDALTLLKEDHDRIKPLLAELKETTDRAEKTRGELFSRIKEELDGARDHRGGDLLPDPEGSPQRPRRLYWRATRSTTWSAA